MKCPCCGEEMVLTDDRSWTAQLNCYRWLASQYGVSISKLQIIALLRDWSKPEAKRTPDYPQAGVVVIDIPVWPEAQTEAFLRERIALHESAKLTLPECSPEDTWERPSKWAVQKPGAKRATKVYDNQHDAENHARSSGLEVEFRPGERPRCSDYCLVADHCSQFQQWKGVQ